LILISAAAILLSAQQSPPPEMRLMRFPAVHGDTVVFTYASDLWTAPLSGGYARRMTSHPGTEQNAFFSPDGSKIAFTAQYDGNTDVYVMDADGGEPKRLTFEPNGDSVAGWTPDGKIAYTSSYGSFTGRQRRMWLVDPKGGLPQETPIAEVGDLSLSPDGSKVAYNRQISNRFNWRRYRGGSQGYISIYDLKSGAYKELPHERENSWNPMWVGNSIYFVSDKNQHTVNLYRYDLDSGKTTQLTRYADADIHWPSTDGKTIVFERDGYLYSFDIASSKAEKITPKVKGDLLATRPMLRRLGSELSNISLSPSGARVAVEARGELFSVPAKNGDTRNFTNSSSSRERFPNWSPDGKTIAYLSDATGAFQIYTQPQMGGDATQVSNWTGADITGMTYSSTGKHIAFMTYANQLVLLDPATKQTKVVYRNEFGSADAFDFSPDDKWIAYIDVGKNLFGAVYLYEIATGKSTKVTEGYYRDDSVSFDQSGKYLYVISARTINPAGGAFESNMNAIDAQRVYAMVLSKDTPNPLEPKNDEEPAGGPAKQPDGPTTPAETKVDFDGLASRMVPLPMPAGNYGAIIGLNNSVLYYSSNTISKFDLGSRQSSTIFAGFMPGSWSMNANRSKLAYYTQGVLGIVDIHPGITVGEGRVDTSSVSTVIDPRDEWKQIFWEAWRYQRDNFYDPSMLGLDWKSLGQRYSQYLPYVAHRSDLNYVMALMIGEFGTSHAYVEGGDMGAPVPTISIGQLGADYENAGGKVRFKKIYPGLQFEEARRGPLGAPGVNVKEGDYLLAINGKPVDANNPPDSLLVDKVGKPVQLTVNSSPSMAGARTVQVRPIGGEGELRYISWIEDNRRKVAEMSGGRIGYMYVPDTSTAGMIEFLKGYYSQSDKDAMIIDERWNGGGSIPTFYIEKLMRQTVTAMRTRTSPDIGFPIQALNGPKVMLINGYAGSGGDMFPFLFRKAKLGPLIGERTWGGLVGYSGAAPLVDGGFMSSPSAGFYDPDTGEWIGENKGIDPDIRVDARPDLVAKGQDPQLAKAVEYLMGELRKSGKATKRPDFIPVPKSGGGG
jgi:tricorn protease